MSLRALQLYRVTFPEKKLVLIVKPELKVIAVNLSIVDEVICDEKTFNFLRHLFHFSADTGICLFQNRYLKIFRSIGVKEILALQGPEQINESDKIPEMLFRLVADSLSVGGPRTVGRLATSNPWNKFDRTGLSSTEAYVVIHCDATYQFKSLPVWLIGYIAEASMARGFQVYLTGENAGLSVAEMTKLCLIDLRGRTSLVDVLSLCQKASAVFGPDTGITHFSASNNIPTWVALGPSTADYYGESELFPTRMVWGIDNLACRATARLHSLAFVAQKNCKGRICVNQVKGECLSSMYQSSAENSINNFMTSRVNPND